MSVNGVELHVEETGDGPPALVLHGGLGIDHTPYRSLDPLGAHLRLVYYDHRGNGRSGGDVDTMTMAQWASDAAGLAKVVGDDEPVVVIGHSFGGFIAQETAITHPEAVRALVLVTTTPGQLGEGEQPAPEGPPMPEGFAALVSDLPDTDEDLAVAMGELLPAYLHQASVDGFRQLMSGVVFRVAAMRRGFEELGAWSAVDRLSGVEVPALVMAGRHDGFTSWPQADRIAARLPDAEVVVFEDSCHFPWLDEPDRFFQTVADWLQRRDLA